MREERMLRYFSMTLAACGLLLFAVGCASSQPLDTELSDAEITGKVKTKLAADPDVNPFNVDVDTTAGVVRLTGEVEKVSAREQAEQLARSTEGVIDVDNDIEIGRTTLAERIDDAAITTKIKTKLAADPQINPFNIDVDTSQGVVTLSGSVEKELARDEAERLARTTDGVHDVRNLIEVESD